MSGYSGKPLSEKLGLKAGDLIAVIGAPPSYRDLLEPLPAGLRFVGLEDQPRLIHYFCTEHRVLGVDFPVLRRALRDDTALWISWPKKTSGLRTDVTADVVREIALPTGLVDNKICAVDETWSAMRLVIRLVHRQPTPKTRDK